MIDVTIAESDGHWDHADIKRLIEYRDALFGDRAKAQARIAALEAALTDVIAFADPDSIADQRTDVRLRLGYEAVMENARALLDSVTSETKGMCNCGSPYGPHKPDCNVFVECPTPKIGAKHGY